MSERLEVLFTGSAAGAVSGAKQIAAFETHPGDVREGQLVVLHMLIGLTNTDGMTDDTFTPQFYATYTGAEGSAQWDMPSTVTVGADGTYRTHVWMMFQRSGNNLVQLSILDLGGVMGGGDQSALQGNPYPNQNLAPNVGWDDGAVTFTVSCDMSDAAATTTMVIENAFVEII